MLFSKPMLWSLCLLVACTPVIVLGPTGQNNEPQQKIANPASVFCLQQNGRSEIRNGTLGATGYCIFSDRSWCEEWQFFRGECKPGQRFDL
jgi:putative hemolysin